MTPIDRFELITAQSGGGVSQSPSSRILEKGSATDPFTTAASLNPPHSNAVAAREEDDMNFFGSPVMRPAALKDTHEDEPEQPFV